MLKIRKIGEALKFAFWYTEFEFSFEMDAQLDRGPDEGVMAIECKAKSPYARVSELSDKYDLSLRHHLWLAIPSRTPAAMSRKQAFFHQ